MEPYSMSIAAQRPSYNAKHLDSSKRKQLALASIEKEKHIFYR